MNAHLKKEQKKENKSIKKAKKQQKKMIKKSIKITAPKKTGVNKHSQSAWKPTLQRRYYGKRCFQTF